MRNAVTSPGDYEVCSIEALNAGDQESALRIINDGSGASVRAGTISRIRNNVTMRGRSAGVIPTAYLR